MKLKSAVCCGVFGDTALDWKLAKIINSPVPINNNRAANNRCKIRFFWMLDFGCWVFSHFPISHPYLGNQPALKTTVKPRKITVSAQVTRFNVFSALLVLLNN